MKTRIGQIVLAAVAFGSLAPGLIASAQSTVQEIVVHPVLSGGAMDTRRAQSVKYGDLDLSKKAGQRALLVRISSAGKKVCAMDSAQLGDKRAEKACYKGAMDSAVRDLGNADVSAMYAHGD